METKSTFSSFSELLPANRDDRLLYGIGAHKCELLVVEDFNIVLGCEYISLKNGDTLTECWLYVTETTTMLELSVKRYPAIDIEHDVMLQRKLKFKLVKTD